MCFINYRTEIKEQRKMTDKCGTVKLFTFSFEIHVDAPNIISCAP